MATTIIGQKLDLKKKTKKKSDESDESDGNDRGDDERTFEMNNTGYFEFCWHYPVYPLHYLIIPCYQ